jgi:CHAT domain-containing protein
MNLDSLLVKTMFHEAAGLAHLRDHQLRQSEREFRAAVSLHQNKLATLSRFDERALAARTLAASFRGIADIEWTQNRNPGAAFWTMERFRSPSAASIPRSEEFHSETFVSYADLPSGSVAWVFDDRGLSGTRLGVPAGQVAAAARRLARLCANPDSLSSQINAESRKLYQWLLGPVAARLEPSRILVIVPDESTAGVTFSALLDEQDRFVGERFSTVVASSVADYSSRLRSGPVDCSSRSLIVANPLLGAGAAASFPPLHQAEKEGRVVASRLVSATLLSGREATLGALDQHRASTALLHFAGHGFSNAGNGGLILAPPPGSALPFDVLDGSRLADQDWSRCRLAVLSACSSGAGESAGPVNPESLVRRLLWAGASRVVAGRWNLDAESSFSLVDRFYSALGKGRDVPEALQLAAREVRDNPATAHPYYWAGFQTFGSR